MITNAVAPLIMMSYVLVNAVEAQEGELCWFKADGEQGGSPLGARFLISTRDVLTTCQSAVVAEGPGDRQADKTNNQRASV